MRIKLLTVGALLAAISLGAAHQFGEKVISVTFDYMRNMFTKTAPTLGNEILVKVPDGYPPISELHISRVLSGTNVIMKGPNEK